MKRLTEFPLVYLATPYTKYRDGIECAFKDAAALAARLLREGVKVYSPIAHTHPIAIYGNLDPLDHKIWMPFDEAMMTASAALLVANLPGWRESYGVAHEIEFFTNAGKPVFYLERVLLKVGRVPFDLPLMTPAQQLAQVRSFEIGQMMLDHPEMTRERAEAIVDSVIEGSVSQPGSPSPENPNQNRQRASLSPDPIRKEGAGA